MRLRKPLLPQTRVSARWPRETTAPSALPTRAMASPAINPAITTAPVSATAVPFTHALPAVLRRLALHRNTNIMSGCKNVLPARPQTALLAILVKAAPGLARMATIPQRLMVTS